MIPTQYEISTILDSSSRSAKRASDILWFGGGDKSVGRRRGVCSGVGLEVVIAARASVVMMLW